MREVLIGATYLKAHGMASSLAAKRGDLGRLIRRSNGGMSTKLHAVTNGEGAAAQLLHDRRPDQRLYCIGAALLDELPKVQWLLADRG